MTDNVIGVTLSGLRQKLEVAQAAAGAAPEELQIKTVRGVGYRLVAQPRA